MAKWSYEDLETAIRSGTRPNDETLGKGLFSLVSDESELDEPGFVDAVSRNLRLGRVLLLVVGEGIREGVETLAEYLQMHAGFHFTLGIIEMSVFRFPPQGFLVQPRILARTVNIERGIVKLVTVGLLSSRLKSPLPSSHAQSQKTNCVNNWRKPPRRCWSL